MELLSIAAHFDDDGTVKKCRRWLRKPIVTRNIDPLALSYIAGLVDGEGSAWMGWPLDKRRDKRYPSANVEVQMCDEGPVKFCQETLGGYFGTKSRKTKSGKSVYVWIVSNRQAGSIALTLYPYCRNESKKAQLMSVIAYFGDEIRVA